MGDFQLSTEERLRFFEIFVPLTIPIVKISKNVNGNSLTDENRL